MADVRCVYFGTDGKPKETKNADTVVVGGGIKTSTGTLTVNGASDVILSTAGTERARILASNGNVGIGVTSPTSLLHMRKDVDGGTQAWLYNNNSGTTAAAQFLAGDPADSGRYLAMDYNGTGYNLGVGYELLQGSQGVIATGSTTNNGLLLVSSSPNAASKIVFGVGELNAAAEAMRINLAKNVSIGTTSDLAQLAVDNGSTAESILVCRDNGTTVLTVEDGGQTDHKTHAAFAGSGSKEHTAAVQTANDTVTTLDAITLADNTLYWIEVNAIGRDTSGTDRAFYKLAVRAHRQGGGANLGTINMIVEDESNAAWDCTFDTNSNDVRVRVTGAAATTINWVCTVNIQAVSGNS